MLLGLKLNGWNQKGVKMEFKETQAIYLQIVDWMCDSIIRGKWNADGRIPSVRELGILLEVNPNTVMRAYECLQNQQVIYNKRGVGFFVCEDAVARIMEKKREEFVGQVLPDLFRQMKLLNILPEEIASEFEKWNRTGDS